MQLQRPLAVVTPTVEADVLAVLAGATAEFTGRQVHQVGGKHSEQGVRLALGRLFAQGIVLRRRVGSGRVGSADLFSPNRQHLAAPYVVALAGLKAEFLARLRAELHSWLVQPAYVALFGSAARGDMSLQSDIDVLVIRPEPLGNESAWEEQLRALGEAIHGWTGNDGRVLELTGQEVARGLATNARVLRDVRAEGLTLAGASTYLQPTARTPDV